MTSLSEVIGLIIICFKNSFLSNLGSKSSIGHPNANLGVIFWFGCIKTSIIVAFLETKDCLIIFFESLSFLNLNILCYMLLLFFYNLGH